MEETREREKEGSWSNGEGEGELIKFKRVLSLQKFAQLETIRDSMWISIDTHILSSLGLNLDRIQIGYQYIHIHIYFIR